MTLIWDERINVFLNRASIYGLFLEPSQKIYNKVQAGEDADFLELEAISDHISKQELE